MIRNTITTTEKKREKDKKKTEPITEQNKHKKIITNIFLQYLLAVSLPPL